MKKSLVPILGTLGLLTQSCASNCEIAGAYHKAGTYIIERDPKRPSAERFFEKAVDYCPSSKLYKSSLEEAKRNNKRRYSR